MNLVDFIADFTHDSSVAHSTIEGFIDYGNGKLSVPSMFDCSEECVKGRYEGNFDIRNSRYEEGQFKVPKKYKRTLIIFPGFFHCHGNQSRSFNY